MTTFVHLDLHLAWALLSRRSSPTLYGPLDRSANEGSPAPHPTKRLFDRALSPRRI